MEEVIETEEQAPSEEQATPQWTPPTYANEDEWRKAARDFALNEEIEIGGRKAPRREFERTLPQFTGLNAKHQQVVASEKELRSALENVVQGLRSPQGFQAIAAEIGVDPYELAQQLVMQRQQWQSMTPEQRELAELRQRQAQWEHEQKARQEAEQNQRQEAENEAIRDYYLDVFDRGFEKIGWYPNDNQVRHAVAYASAIAEQALTEGRTMTDVQIAQQVRAAMAPNSDVRGELAKMTPKDRAALLSDEDRAYLRQMDLEASKRPQTTRANQPRNQATGQFAKPEGDGPIVASNFRDFQKQMQARRGR